MPYIVYKGIHRSIASKEAETDAEKYLEKIEELEQRLFELQGEIGGGRHVPPGVRVLSLHDNPAQQWVDLSQAAMDRLKSENEALLNRLKELENSGASTGHSGNKEELVPRESWEVVNKEKSELEEALKQKEKRLTRLKQVNTWPSFTSFMSLLIPISGSPRYSQRRRTNSKKR